MPQTIDTKGPKSIESLGNFNVEVSSRRISEPTLLPPAVLLFVVSHIMLDVRGTLEDDARVAFEAEFPPITEDDSQEHLLATLEKLKRYYAVDELLEKTYPILYQVATEDPNGPIVSFFSFSDEVMDKHVLVAWTAASTSRSDDPYSVMFENLLNIISQNEAFAARKIENFGITYGHSSILELVPVFIFINNIPISYAYLVHHLIETYSSQELSTRYVELENLYIRPIEDTLDLSTIPAECQDEAEFIRDEWKGIQEMAVANYLKWKQLVLAAYQEQFGDTVDGVAIKQSTKDARALDIARYMIPIGAPTSMAVLSNVRTFISLLRQIREIENPELHQLANQLEYCLRVFETEEGSTANARIGPLIKHAEAQNIIRTNVQTLEDYLLLLPGFEDMLSASRAEVIDFNREINVSLLDNTDNVIITVIQYIKVAYPTIDEMAVLNWLGTLDADQQAMIGSIIFKDHDRHHPMGNMGNIKSDRVYVIKAALAQLRDWNRHRASGKADVGFLLPIIHNTGPINFEDILTSGFAISPQMLNTEKLIPLIDEWKTDVNAYYNRLLEFYRFLRTRFPEASLVELTKLVPLGHMTTFHMSTPVSQDVYTKNLRGTPGNDLANREIDRMMIDIGFKSPFLRDVKLGYTQSELDYNSAEQYNDRT